MAPMIDKETYDKYSRKLDDLISNRNNTHDPMARLALTKKINKLENFLNIAEIKL